MFQSGEKRRREGLVVIKEEWGEMKKGGGAADMAQRKGI